MKKSKNEKVFYIRFYSITLTVWEWLVTHVTDFPKILPPTFEVVNRRILTETAEDGTSQVIPARLVSSFVQYCEENDEFDYAIMPIVNNVIFYRNAYEKIVHMDFDDMCPGIVMSLLIAHDALHEILHYLDMWREYTKDYTRRIDAMDGFLNYIVDRLGTPENELQNETLTLRLFELMVIDCDSKVSFASLIHDYEKGESEPLVLMPKAGGPYLEYLKKVDSNLYAGYLAVLYKYCSSCIVTRTCNYGTDLRMHRYIYNNVMELWKSDPERIEYHDC